MASRYRTQNIIVLTAFILSAIHTNAQDRVLNIKEYSMRIFGTTNIHDFESDITELNAQLILDSSFQVKSLLVEIPVKSLESGNKAMDRTMYKTFNAEKHPEISFKLTDANTSKVKNKLRINANGILEMNGAKKPINLKANGNRISPGLYSFEGKIILNMTDFKMQPPTSLMGLIKVDDNIRVNYDIIFAE